MQEKPDFKTAFLALMEEETAGDHPAGDALAAYRTGDLASADRERVHSHLAGCRECAELARDLDVFTEAPGSGEAADEFEVAAFLRALKPQLDSRVPARGTPWRRPLALAASLIFSVGASWWLSRTVTKREIVAELSQLRVNVSVTDLAEDTPERGSDQEQAVKIRVDDDVTLVLTPDQPGDYPGYRLDVLDDGGQLLRSIPGLEKDPKLENFTLGISPGFLAAGRYRLELYGLEDGRAEPVASYPLSVVGGSKERL